MTNCPCGSGLAFDACCGGVLADVRTARTAEQLMRARYTAYVQADVAFLRESLDQSGRESFDEEGARQWAESATWKGIEILSVDGGGEDDDRGYVEFVATYEIDDREQAHHERALFQREEGVWRFVEGRVFGSDPYVRDDPKVGRNEPCPCGSGRKYKKCCGV